MPRHPAYTPELVDAACALWAVKITYKQLARILGVDMKQLNYMLNVVGRDVLKKYKEQFDRTNAERMEVINNCKETNGGTFYVEQSGEACTQKQ